MRKPNCNPARPCSGRRLWRVLFLIPFFLSFSTSAQTLHIAAASDLQFVLPDLAAQYEKQTGAKLAITYGSSGNFFAQIQNGAPFDLFLSADTDFPKKLVEAGLADEDSLATYASGSLVLWVPSDSPLNPASSGLKTLLDSRVQKIAIANPEHAPYGRAAVLALRKAGLYDLLKPKFVYGENISQAAQFVQSGSAQAGLIARSLALSPSMKSGKRYDVSGSESQPFEQAAVALKSSSNGQAARAFLVFLKTPVACAILEGYGFGVPRTACSEPRP